MTTEDDTWAQTLITVTPEEDATLREISEAITLSSTSDTQLHLDPDNIVYRRSFTHRQFFDALNDTEGPLVEGNEKAQREIEIQKEDAEIQTYLVGVPDVRISIDYRDETSQTMYMSPPCPPLKYFKDIMTSMNEGPMPTIKKTNVAATVFTFDPDTSEDVVIKILSEHVTKEEIENLVFQFSPEEETEMEATEILCYLIARVFWINDPSAQADISMADAATQTHIIYNNFTRTFVIDRQTQTELTCEPKESNTKLLTDYLETKCTILNYLEDCISKAIDARIVIDEIVKEIIDKGAERIRFPMKEEVTQTVATYKVKGENEEDVMRKLRLNIIIDPFEASIAVVPLMDDLLHIACEVVSKDATTVSRHILSGLFKRISHVIIKLEELQQETKRKPIDKIFAKRKEKINELMSKRETETISTQTSIAAIAEVKKIKKSQEILCSVCKRQSMCQWCMDNGEAESFFQQENKILRTQDILLAYKPCYIVTKATEKEKYPLLPPCPENKPKPPILFEARPSINSSGESCETISIFLQDGKNVDTQESDNVWSYVADATLMKSYSLKESVSSSSQTTISFLNESTCQNLFSRRSNVLTSEAVNALQILKQTFCNRENCSSMSLHVLKKDKSFIEDDEMYNKLSCICPSRSHTDNKIYGHMFHIQGNRTPSKLHLSKRNTYSHSASSRKKLNEDGFKIIPICVSQNCAT